jgi:hypothetical protein
MNAASTKVRECYPAAKLAIVHHRFPKTFSPNQQEKL